MTDPKHDPSDPFTEWVRQRRSSAPGVPSDFAERILQQLTPPRKSAGPIAFAGWIGKVALVAGITLMAVVRTYSSLYLMCSHQF